MNSTQVISSMLLLMSAIALGIELISAAGVVGVSSVSKQPTAAAEKQPSVNYDSELDSDDASGSLTSKAALVSGSSKFPVASTVASAKSDMSHSLDDDSADEDEPIRVAGSSAAPSSLSSAASSAAGYHYPGHEHHDNQHYGASHHGDHHYGKYYQYASVPYPYAWEFGYRRGNPYHTIERHEKGKGPHFHTKVKWSDKYGGYGVHVWDYNHDDHHKSHYGHEDSHGDSHYGGHHSGHHGPSHYGHH